PERKAALDRELREAVKKVRDPSLRRHYGDEVNRLRRALFDGQRPTRKNQGNFRPRGQQFGRYTPPATPMVETKASALAAAGAPFEEQLKEAVILATLVSHPQLVADFIAELETLETSQSEHEAVRDALIHSEGADRKEIERICGSDALVKLFQPRHVRISPGVREGASPEVAAMSVAEELAKLSARRGARREIDDAMRDLDGLVDEGLTWRLGQAAEALNSTARNEHDDTAEYDTGPNGARLKRDEKSAFDDLIGRIKYSKNEGGAA
ncbi:MAG: hypothetical protein ABJC34_07195, partial [Marinomonas sp.]